MSAELTSLVPDEVPKDPIYFTFIDGKVHIPQIVLSQFESKSNNEDPNNNDEVIDETHEFENVNDDSSDEGPVSTRLDWGFTSTKLLLAILKERKEKRETFSKNMWKSRVNEG